MDRHSVHVRVIHEPDYLVREKLSIVLRIQVRFGRFRGIELQAFSDSFPQNIQCRVSLL